MIFLRIILALLSVPCIFLYFHYVWIPYMQWVGHSYVWNTATNIYLAGVVMHMACIIPHDRRGTLVVFGVPIALMLGPGPWLIPNFLHVTISLWNWAILGRVAIEGEENEYVEPDYHRLHINTNDPLHHVHSDASLLTMALYRNLRHMGSFIVGYNKGKPHESISRFGFRVMLIAFMWALFIDKTVAPVPSYEAPSIWNFHLPSLPEFKIPDWLSKAGEKNPTAIGLGNKTEEPFAGDQEGARVMVSVQLHKGTSPIMPEAEDFVPSLRNDIHEFFLMDGDPRKYFVYAQPSPGSVYAKYVNESLCQIITPGRKVTLYTELRPTNVIEMEDHVEYYKKRSAFDFGDWIELLWDRNLKAQSKKTTTTWRYLYRHWDPSEMQPYTLMGVAKPQSELQERSYGGIVCF